MRLRAPATAKLNLALVVGAARDDGRHEVVTVLQRIDLADRIEVSRAATLRVSGFRHDTLVESALQALADASGVAPSFEARIQKRIPVASGLGGGSSDAATALQLANRLLEPPLAAHELARVAAGLGADVPFFLTRGPQLGEGIGERLSALDLPQDYWVVLALAHGSVKSSSAAVYRAFDARRGERGFELRREALLSVLAETRRPRDLARLPANDLASSPLADELLGLGAFRADVTGAGPVVYGLYHHRATAQAARRRLRGRARTWLTVPSWYG